MKLGCDSYGKSTTPLVGQNNGSAGELLISKVRIGNVDVGSDP
jgi:hypothetical protein